MPDNLSYEELMKPETPDPVLPFEKHRGKYASQVDVEYLDWLIGQDWLKRDLREGIEAHLQTRAEWHRLGQE